MLVTFLWAQARSKDPNTKVGAAVYDPTTGAFVLGYNGFPPDYPDDEKYWDCRDASSPDAKYHRVIHAEANAIRKAWQLFGDTSKCELYITHFPCERCIKDWIIPSNIKWVYFAADSRPASQTSVGLNPISKDLLTYSDVTFIPLERSATGLLTSLQLEK